MRLAPWLVTLVTIAVSACGEADDGDSNESGNEFIGGSTNGTTGSSATGSSAFGGSGTTGSAANNTNGSATNGSATNGSATNSFASGTNGSTANTTGGFGSGTNGGTGFGSSSGGSSDGSTGGQNATGDASNTSGGSEGAGTSGGISTSGPGPKIPEITGTCPPLRSGVTTIHGLETNIYAGTPSPGKKGPLLFYWHGTAGRGSMAELDLPRAMRDEILAEGGMIVAPTDAGPNREGSDVTFLLGVWFTPGDLILADQVVACAVRDYNIDPRRIYTTGASAGGLMSGVMALNRSSYVAASVPNSGGIAVAFPPLSTIEDRSHIPPVMCLHGDPQRDTVIISFADSSRTLNQIVTRAGGFAINCNHGGGHAFPPAELKLASWQFMKDHPFGVEPEPYAAGLPASFPSYCEIFK